MTGLSKMAFTKKPAVAPSSSIMKKPAKAPSGSSGSTPGSTPGDDDDLDGTKPMRDRMKSRHFAGLFDVLPKYIQMEWNDIQKDKSGQKRDKATILINKAVQKVNGKYQVMTEGAWFEEI